MIRKASFLYESLWDDSQAVFLCGMRSSLTEGLFGFLNGRDVVIFFASIFWPRLFQFFSKKERCRV